jgi:peroxiredoxin
MQVIILLSLALMGGGFTGTAARATPHDALLQAAGLSAVEPSGMAPDFELSDHQGKRVRLHDLRGKVVFVNFWATWCPPCIHEMPMMQQLLDSRKQQAFALLALNLQESQEDVAQFMKKKGLQFPALLDSEGRTAASYKVRGLPASYLIDCSGHLLGSVTGVLAWTREATQTLLDTLLKDNACQET